MNFHYSNIVVTLKILLISDCLLIYNINIYFVNKTADQF